MRENKPMWCLTCLQWFSNTIRQVSGSAVHGLDGAACRPVRVPGPLGFKRLSQLILTHRLIQIRSRGQQGKNKGGAREKHREGEKGEKGGGGGKATHKRCPKTKKWRVLLDEVRGKSIERTESCWCLQQQSLYTSDQCGLSALPVIQFAIGTILHTDT